MSDVIECDAAGLLARAGAPTSNAIYRRIGYELVAAAAEVRFRYPRS